jgi:hypothetical protein
MMRPLEAAVAQLAHAPDSVFGVDLTPFKSAIKDAASRIETLEKDNADFAARIHALEAKSAPSA